MTVVNLILSLFCIFEAICVPAVFLHMRLWGVVLLYAAGVVLFFFLLGRKKMLPWQRKQAAKLTAEPEKQNTEPTGLNAKTEKRSAKSAKIRRLRILCMMLVLFQLVLAAGYRHTDDDDAWYLGTAVSAYETEEIFAYSPYTGNPMELADGGDYVLSPLPILWAAIAKALHIHPTILAHTIVPVFMLLFAYAVYWMLGKRLFLCRENGRMSEDGGAEQYGAYVFFLLINILNLFGYFSTRTSGAFLLFRSWQGKAVFCAILVPLMFYYFLGLLQRGETEGKEDLLGMYLTMGAGCLASFTAVSLMPLLLLAMALTYAVAKRSLRLPLKLCGALIPNVVLIVIYVTVF